MNENDVNKTFMNVYSVNCYSISSPQTRETVPFPVHTIVIWTEGKVFFYTVVCYLGYEGISVFWTTGVLLL